MDISKDWSAIRIHFSKSFATNMHVAIASVDSNNMPCVTPIGTLFLNQNQTGFYFERYTSTLPRNAQSNNNVCVLSVNSSKWFWLKSLFKGKFNQSPALKLYGKLGVRRKATVQELRALKSRMKATKRLKGHHILWDDMIDIREISFSKVEVMKLGKML